MVLGAQILRQTNHQHQSRSMTPSVQEVSQMQNGVGAPDLLQGILGAQGSKKNTKKGQLSTRHCHKAERSKCFLPRAHWDVTPKDSFRSSQCNPTLPLLPIYSGCQLYNHKHGIRQSSVSKKKRIIEFQKMNTNP